MQLVAYGAQDIYLTGNPQITFFKVVYRRHTNFSMESIEQQYSGSQGFGQKVTATVARNGDLIHNMYVEWNPLTFFDNTDVDDVAANLGHTLLSEIELEIGGQRIDRHYGHWLTVWENLTQVNPLGNFAAPTADTLAEPTSGATLSQLNAYNHQGCQRESDNSAAPAVAHVPLQFWFCRNPGLALPLIALQYHEVKVAITFCAAGAMSATGTNSFTFQPTKLWVDYIYLDTDERRRFAQQSHEYLIEQLQFHSQGSATARQTSLNFNHPVKELIWTGVPDTTAVDDESHFSSAATPGQLGTDGGIAATDNFTLKLNGHERFSPRHLQYFTRTQVHQHHTGFGGVSQADSIAVYSFALKPEEHQPSGTCNFSRIDNAIMEHPAHAATDANAGNRVGRNAGINFYAVNYNVLRVMSGMGGLAYSN